MGHDITAISNHNLDVSSVETLAKDLSARLGFNIKYGYFPMDEYNELLQFEPPEGFVVFGEAGSNTNDLSYRLIDENYQVKQLAEKYGLEIFEDMRYWSKWGKDLPDADYITYIKEKTVFNYYCMEIDDDSESVVLDVHNHMVHNSFAYYSRWWSLCDTFVGTTGYTPEYFLDFRVKLRDSTIKMGGNKMLFLDDHSKVLGKVGYDVTWQEMIELVKIDSRNLLLDIPEYYLNAAYRESFLVRNEKPLAFEDDWRDLDH